jgi:hypothetical protein
MQAEYEQLVHANAQLPATVALSPQQMVVDPDYVTSLQVTVIVITLTVTVLFLDVWYRFCYVRITCT